MNGSFDANQFQPKQGMEGHPVGQFPFNISNTSIEATKDNTGGMFVVEFTTPTGVAKMRYNLWNSSPKAVEIAHGQLSALCHATGVYRLDWGNEGAALRNAVGQIVVGYQKGEEPSPEKPHGGYTEIKKVLDRNGNEPGKPPQQPGNQQQPGQGGWGGGSPSPSPAPAAAPATPAAPTGWGAPASPPTSPPVTPGWAPGPSAPAGSAPPWAKQ